MIWIQFSTPDGSSSTTFAGTQVRVHIKVLTDPPVEGIAVEGKIGPAGCLDHDKESLNFDASSTASYDLKKSKHQEGKYIVEAMVSKKGYQDTTLSASFYYMYDEPHDLPEWDAEDLNFLWE